MTDLTHILKSLSRITLSDNERLSMRERLAAYAAMHPVLPDAATAQSGFFAMLASRRFSVYAGTLVALVVLGGGVSFAADGSVPGDTLYPIKIHLNEPIMTALASTNLGQANVASLLATRRVAEAVTLAERGTLSSSTQTYLTDQFSSQVAIATDKANALAASGHPNAAITVKANLAANLAGQAQALGALSSTEVDGRRAATDALLSRILAESDSVTPDDTGAAVAVITGSDGGTTTATTTVTEDTRVVSAAAMKKSTGTTTPDETSATSTPNASAYAHVFSAGRFVHRLELTASTTFPGRLASTTMSVPNFHSDSAIPLTHAQSDGGGDSSNLDIQLND